MFEQTMEGKRFSEEQIIAVLKELEAGANTKDSLPEIWNLGGDVLQLEGEASPAVPSKRLCRSATH
jgi:hypothetical protein